MNPCLCSAAAPPISLVTSCLPLEVPKLPTLNLPSLLPESFVRLPIPVTSLVKLPTSQQIRTFTPYMSDPIVHTPVIDVLLWPGVPHERWACNIFSHTTFAGKLCKSYSHPKHRVCGGESARETLRMLMASTLISSCQKPMIVLPESDKVDENPLGFPRSNLDAAAAVSQGIYGGVLIEDVEAVAAGLFSMGLYSSRSKVDDCVKRGKLKGNSHECLEDSSED